MTLPCGDVCSKNILMRTKKSQNCKPRQKLQYGIAYQKNYFILDFEKQEKLHMVSQFRALELCMLKHA